VVALVGFVRKCVAAVHAGSFRSELAVPPACAPRVLVPPKVSVQSVAAPSTSVRLIAGGLVWTVLRVHVCAHQVLDKMLELLCRFRL
jgi:hypothetical protein